MAMTLSATAWMVVRMAILDMTFTCSPAWVWRSFSTLEIASSSPRIWMTRSAAASLGIDGSLVISGITSWNSLAACLSLRFAPFGFLFFGLLQELLRTPQILQNLLAALRRRLVLDLIALAGHARHRRSAARPRSRWPDRSYPRRRGSSGRTEIGVVRASGVGVAGVVGALVVVVAVQRSLVRRTCPGGTSTRHRCTGRPAAHWKPSGSGAWTQSLSADTGVGGAAVGVRAAVVRVAGGGSPGFWPICVAARRSWPASV